MTAATAASTIMEITNLLRARNQLISVRTNDEFRAEGGIWAGGIGARYTETFYWDCARGVTNREGGQVVSIQDPAGLLSWIRDQKGRAIYVLRDLHKWFAPDVLRGLRSFAREQRIADPAQMKAIILVSPMSMEVPKDLPEMVPIDYPLPDREELGKIHDDVVTVASRSANYKGSAAATNGERERIIDAALGLSALQAENAFAQSLVAFGRVDVLVVANEKKRVIAGIPGVTWYDPLPGGMDAVGGVALLKNWLLSRKPAFTQNARAFGLPLPKGIMLVGPPGGGKSLTAKCVATTFTFPLIRFDLAAMLSKFVGESEGNFRQALAVVEMVAPCVLWIDEIEKGLAGSSGEQGDGGTSAKALGGLLTWMQEHTSAVFVVATANDVRALPPELLRKGRFDEMFFVDLPQPMERQEIVVTALKARGRKPDGIDLAAVSAACDGFVGAEIDSLVPEALFDAYSDNARAVTTEDLLSAASRIVPLSKTASEKILSLKEWAKGRARPASAPEATTNAAVRSLDL